MATPIRMAPVLYGKDAEFFFEQWEKMLATPLKNPITKDEKAAIDAFIAKNERKKYAELVD